MAGFDANTKLLIHFDGTDGQNFYIAETGQTVTFFATAQLDTAQKVFGASSLLTDGNSDYITLANDSGFDIVKNTTSSNIVEARVRFATNTGAEQMVIEHYASSNGRWYIRADNEGYWRIFFRNTSGVIGFNVTGGSWTTNTDYHVALIIVNDKVGFYVNGTRVISTTLATTQDMTGLLYIGRSPNGWFVNGWIDEVRIQNSNYFGVDPSTDTTIVVPTEAYSAIVQKRNQGIIII